MSKLSKYQGIVITGYTGIMVVDFSSFHADVESRMGRPVWTHEFANKEFFDEVKELYAEEFRAICAD